MKCDICEQETDRTYDLVLFHCGLRYKLCEKCHCMALGKNIMPGQFLRRQ